MPTSFSKTLLLLLFTVGNFYICPALQNFFGKELGEGMPVPAFHKILSSVCFRSRNLLGEEGIRDISDCGKRHRHAKVLRVYE